MDYLPAPVIKWLEGRIDPTSQRLVEQYSQYFLVLLVAVAFVISFALKSVMIGLEVFLGGFVLLLGATVPPWPCLNRHPIKFLPVRQPTYTLTKESTT
ncbi:uncharacterized protein MKK02DRAFT_42491 [Dioszegia hungarica]|uniref:Signal peptidase complex subunit 1 n=1 Tax=Dioszegia hungarica TaxID=4972 RepID=A0AA38HDC2_9TREE|nr:uncharacterized protein MKK02DRAFT_42491 [Dioszegia hungarica]KAI9638103.1 hypothetical protein MKK02DRAFT_42491 [Dioszegia hungarica]